MKNILKFFFAKLLISIDKDFLGKVLNTKKFLILTYHRVLPLMGGQKPYFRERMVMPLEVFEEQLKFLRQYAHVVPLRECLANLRNGVPFSPKTVVITFDDGYIDNHTYAFPLLKKYQIPATIFLSTYPIDNNSCLWWDCLADLIAATAKDKVFRDDSTIAKLISSCPHQNSVAVANYLVDHINGLPRKEFHSILEELNEVWQDGAAGVKAKHMLTWANIREMAKHNISFEAHTVNHWPVDNINKEIFFEEIVGSRDRIRKEIDQPGDIFACPRGNRFPKDIDDLVHQYFIGQCTTMYGSNTLDSSPYELKRKDTGYSFAKNKYRAEYFWMELAGCWDRFRR